MCVEYSYGEKTTQKGDEALSPGAQSKDKNTKMGKVGHKV
jgi:hypothetical protein